MFWKSEPNHTLKVAKAEEQYTREVANHAAKWRTYLEARRIELELKRQRLEGTREADHQ